MWYLINVLIYGFVFHQQNAVVTSFDFDNNACDQYHDYPVWFLSSNCDYNPDVLSDPESMAERNGYPFQSHSLTTEDGYILNMFQISPKDPEIPVKAPVLIHHGLITNSAVWLDLGTLSLAFVLAAKGHEVWLANMRGTTFANQHETLTVHDKEYWKFNIDDIVENDLPKQLNYVANATNRTEKIIFIGHSLGTIIPFMYISNNNEEANNLLQGFIALAPPIYTNDTNEIVVLLGKLAPAIKHTFNTVGITGLLYQENKIHQLLIHVCRSLPFLCKQLLTASFGKITDQFLPNYLLLFFTNWPAGVSVDLLTQLGQNAKDGAFTKFNYGTIGNLEAYGQVNPPEYDLTKITLPVYIFYGRNDIIATEQNAQRLWRQLGSRVKQLSHIPLDDNLPGFNHLNFMYAKDLDELLYKSIFQAIDNMDNID